MRLTKKAQLENYIKEVKDIIDKGVYISLYNNRFKFALRDRQKACCSGCYFEQYKFVDGYCTNRNMCAMYTDKLEDKIHDALSIVLPNYILSIMKLWIATNYDCTIKISVGSRIYSTIDFILQKVD